MGSCTKASAGHCTLGLLIEHEFDYQPALVKQKTGFTLIHVLSVKG